MIVYFMTQIMLDIMGFKSEYVTTERENTLERKSIP